MKKLLAIVICAVGYVGSVLSSHYTLPLALSYGQGFLEANFTGAKIPSINLSPMPEGFYSTQPSTSDNESSSSLLSKVGSATVSVLRVSVSSVQFALEHKKALSVMAVVSGAVAYRYYKKLNREQNEEKTKKSLARKETIENLYSLELEVKNTRSNLNEVKDTWIERSGILNIEYIAVNVKLEKLEDDLLTIKKNNELLSEKVDEYADEVENLDKTLQNTTLSYNELVEDIKNINASCVLVIEGTKKTIDTQESIIHISENVQQIAEESTQEIKKSNECIKKNIKQSNEMVEFFRQNFSRPDSAQ